MAAVGAAMIMNEHRDGPITFASVASNGASGVLGAVYVNRDVRVKSAVYVPNANAATQGTATTSASYRRFSIINAGTGGAGTTVIGSLNMTASLGSFVGRGFTMAATNVATAASGEVVVLQQATIGGGAQDDGTTLQAGSLVLVYETI